MSETPWWRDPRRLPPSAEASMATPFTTGRVRALRILLVISVVSGIIAMALGEVVVGVLCGTTILSQSLLWSDDQRRQVLGRS